MYSVCNSLMSSEEGSVWEVLVAVNAFCISSNCRYNAFTVCTKGIYSFFLANNADVVVDAGTDEVIFLHHSAGKNTGFYLFSFSVSDSEADGWIFMLIVHGKAPFVLAVATGVIDNLTATGIYLLMSVILGWIILMLKKSLA